MAFVYKPRRDLIWEPAFIAPMTSETGCPAVIERWDHAAEENGVLHSRQAIDGGPPMKHVRRQAAQNGAALVSPGAAVALPIRLGPAPVALALGLLIWGGLPAAAIASDAATFALDCAHREVQVITLIEDHGEKQDVSSDKLAQAGFEMLDAREACYAGHVSEAVALYDRIMTDTLRPLTAQAGR
jgi:hypothetical protein